MISRAAATISIGLLALIGLLSFVVFQSDYESADYVEISRVTENKSQAIHPPSVSEQSPARDSSINSVQETGVSTEDLPPGSAQTDGAALDAGTVRISSTLDAAISEAQRLIEAGRFEDGARVLSELYQEAERYSAEAKIAVYALYANLLKVIEQNQDAIAVFEALLILPGVNADVRLDALIGLGELYNREAEYEAGQIAYETWIAESSTADADAYLGLSYSFYNLQRFEAALLPAIEHVRLVEDQIEDVDVETLMYLNSLAFSTEDWENAEWITKIMIEQFDRPIDWRNLVAIYSAMGDEEARARAFADAVAADKIDETGKLIRD